MNEAIIFQNAIQDILTADLSFEDKHSSLVNFSEDVLKSDLEVAEKKELLVQARRPILRNMARDNYAAFAEYCFYDTESQDLRFIELKDFHREWCSMVENEKRLNLFSPVDHGKTTLLTIGYPLWCLGRNPNMRIFLISATYNQAAKYLSSIKEHILENKYVQEVFPDLIPMPDKIYYNRPVKWAENAIIVKRETRGAKDFSVQSLGVMGPLLNVRADLMILDDVITVKNSATVKGREKIIEWFDSTALKRLTKNAQCIVVGTAWFQSDLAHYLEEKSDWTTMRYSVEEGDKELGCRLSKWNEKFPRSRLKIIEEHSQKEYDRAFRNIAKTADSYPFAGYIEDAINRRVDIDEGWKILMGMDISTKKRPGTVLVVIAYSPLSNKKVVLWVEFGAWNSSKKKSKIKQLYDDFLPEKIIVEANSLQDDLVDDYKRLIGSDGRKLPVRSLTTTEEMKSLWLSDLEEELEEGVWCIKWKSNGHFERMRKELEQYPDYKTSDSVMALIFANSILGRRRRRGIRTTVLSEAAPKKGAEHSDVRRIQMDRKKYSFKDYRPFNKILQRDGRDKDMPPNYLELVKWIQKYQKYDEVDLSNKPRYVTEEEFKIVIDEMVKYVGVLRDPA